MARLGELLTAARLLDADQLGQALRAQVVWGGRLGTNLVELHYIDLDNLARALGRQHGLPAALARHFDGADPELQQRLPAELARKYSVVPLLRVGTQRKIAIASLDPLSRAARRELASALAIEPGELVVSIAGEMRVRYHLERVYQIARSARFLRSPGKTVPPLPHFVPSAVPESDAEIPVEVEPPDPAPSAEAAVSDSGPVALPAGDTAPVSANPDELAELIDAAIASVTAPARPAEPADRSHRTYLRTLADEPATPTLGRIALRQVAVPITEDRPRGVGSTLADATRAIRRGPDRDRIAALVIDALERLVPTCGAAILMMVRGDAAIGWKWFARAGSPPAELAVPMDAPGLVPSAVHRNATQRQGAEDLGTIDRLLLHALGGNHAELAVVPIAVSGTVMCALVTSLEPGAGAEPVEAIAGAAGAGFARLIRDASR